MAHCFYREKNRGIVENFPKVSKNFRLFAMQKNSAKPFMPNVRELRKKPSRMASGHRLCPGCGIGTIMNQVFASVEAPVVMANATGCSEICFSPVPYATMKTPWIHSLFENSASVISGVESCWKAKQKKGELTSEQEKIKFLAVGGDGATYDIGFQWLSGALERGHNFVYVCFDNEGYMNTGYQRSSAVPKGFDTHTSPDGKAIHGKIQHRKNLTKILANHDIPYVAQANPWNYVDLMRKVNHAFEIDGPAVIMAYSPCPTNWKHASEDGLDVARLATEAGLWPLYEVEYGKWKINSAAPREGALEEFLGMQKRTKNLLRKDHAKELEELKEQIGNDWEYLQKMKQVFGN